ncbi:POT family-domain-containing protein [Dunaliella salina]|uniref:POT family-domain-containing protein n=1 Tax=Dunaliella salina TaxID=3046 RepID=A0ABQ7G955_DUNSA|nr:POT family-domain-containing protein [Dunaliella salina]|eukprot:KAF5831125.1 POT family-domain-containing protein [Dunaliella salina]
MKRSSSMLSMPPTSSLSMRWLEDAVTEWQTSQGARVHVAGGLAGYTPKQVEEVKLVLRLLPIFGATVLYWTIYTQMGTLFVQQGNLMDRAMSVPGGDHINIPSASMSIFNTLSIILLIWLYDAYFEPFLMSTERYKMTKLRRQGWGMLVAALAMAYAGAVEVWRLKALREDAAQAAEANGEAYTPNQPAPLSIFWQAPAYFLIGLSEVFTSIGQLEFFYDQAPDVMRSCSMAMCLLSTAMGSYLAGALTWAVQAGSESITGRPWLPNDLNKGRIDLFFFFLGGLMMANLAVFVAVAVRYQYKQVQHKRPRLAIAGGTIYEDHEGGEDVSLYRSSTAPSELVPHPLDGLHSQRLQKTRQKQQREQRAAATSPLSIRPFGGRGSGPGRPIRTGVRQGSDEDDADDIYARSLAYVPPSPNIPAPFR